MVHELADRTIRRATKKASKSTRPIGPTLPRSRVALTARRVPSS